MQNEKLKRMIADKKQLLNIEAQAKHEEELSARSRSQNEPQDHKSQQS